MNVQAESHSGVECRLRLLGGVDVSHLLAGHEALLVVNGCINAAIPTRDEELCAQGIHGSVHVLGKLGLQPLLDMELCSHIVVASRHRPCSHVMCDSLPDKLGLVHVTKSTSGSDPDDPNHGRVLTILPPTFALSACPEFASHKGMAHNRVTNQGLYTALHLHPYLLCNA